MAYLFNSINSQLEDGKENIFQSQSPGVTQEENVGGGGDAIQKSSTSNSSGGGGSGSSGSLSAGKSTTSSGAGTGGYNPAAASSAYKTLQSRVKLPGQALGKISSDLSTAESGLQEQANAYTQKAQDTAKTYDISREQLLGAAQGDDKAYQDTAARLSKTQRDPFEAFKGLEGGIPASADALKKPSALGELYRGEVGPQYTAGQGRFDSMLLRQNPEFQRIQSELLDRQVGLQKTSDKEASDRTTAANELLDKSYRDSTAAARGTLKGLGDEVVTSAKAREAKEDAARAALDAGKIGSQQYQTIAQMIRDDFKGADPRSEQARSLALLDSMDPSELGKYVNIDRDTDWREFIDQAGAGRYNRIQGLLGTGGDVLSVNPQGAGDPYAFDTQGAYQGLLGNLQGQRQAKDREDQAKIDQIIAQLSGQAGGLTKARDARDPLAQARSALETELGGAANADALRDVFEGANWTPYYTSQGAIKEQENPYSWQDLLSSDQASELNNLARDAGLDATYKAGGGAGPEYNLDYFRDLYNRALARRTPAAQAPQGGSGGNTNSRRY